MLIFTRRIGETVKIGDDVSFQVLEIHGKQVRVGVTAPREIPVHREEVYNRIGPRSTLASRSSSEGSVRG